MISSNLPRLRRICCRKRRAGWHRKRRAGWHRKRRAGWHQNGKLKNWNRRKLINFGFPILEQETKVQFFEKITVCQLGVCDASWLGACDDNQLGVCDSRFDEVVADSTKSPQIRQNRGRFDEIAADSTKYYCMFVKELKFVCLLKN